jgi:hypothetical protein
VTRPIAPGASPNPSPEPVCAFSRPDADAPAAFSLRPADGFHSSAGDPALAEKYGHIRTQVSVAPPPSLPPVAPPPGVGVGVGGEGAAPAPLGPPPTNQYSAFAAYGNRPVPRYVTYNTDHTTGPAPMPMYGVGAGMGPGVGVGQGPVAPPAPSPPLPQPHTNGIALVGKSPSPPLQATYPQPQPAPVPMSMPVLAPQVPVYGGAQPQPQPPSMAIPTLPNPNTISVFRPTDDADDAIALDGSVSKQA